ncbi:MAG TPA: ABC transporter permease [Blastocatellia bacterium]|nr:ABC transporter permease [Blastocatellia bacterium]
MWRDMWHGLRMMRRSPGFTFVAVLTLALGIGANTAIFSVVNAVLLRPLPYKEPARLALVQESLPRLGWNFGGIAAAETLDYMAGNESFSEMAAYTTLDFNLTGQGEARRVQAARVSPSLFPLLGVSPIVGRTFAPDEDRPGAGVIILGGAFWRRAFGGDPAAIGQTVKLDEKPYTVIGVMPEAVQFPYTDATFAEPVELWLPLALTDEERTSRANNFQFGVIGRLRPGVMLSQAQANMEAVAARFQQQHPDIYQGDVEIMASVVGLNERTVKNVRPFLLMLLIATGLVLLIACANVANLLLARAAARRKEIAIRAALGAGTLRIVRQLLAESLMLALTGGALGLLLAVWAIDLILKLGPEDVPRLAEVGLDWRVLGFTLLVTVVTGVLFGLAPALQSARLNLTEAIKDAGRGSSAGEGARLRGLLVMAETAVALVLLVGAALLINSFVRLLGVPPGFNPEGVVVARTELPSARYPEAERGKLVYKQVLERLAALPGVQAVGVASNLPLTGEWQIGFRPEGSSEDAVYTAHSAWVSNDYFRAMGIALLKGRTFTDDDRADTTPVIVVNEAMAQRFWPDQEVIGKRIRWGGWNRNGWLTIVGVVADVKLSSLEAEDQPAVYMPTFQIPRLRRSAVFIARTSGDPANLLAAVRQEINGVDADLPVYDLRTMNQVIAESVAQRRFAMLLLGVFAVAALLLAAVGLYGVTAYAVTQRMQEIGIRMALGASRRDVLRLIVGQGMRLALVGVGAGLLAAVAATRLMKSLLFAVSATDVTTFVAVAAVLTLVALGACFVPALRATRVDPMVALRYE